MLNQFYTLKNIEARESGGSMDLELNPEHAVYSGHFPGMPIVPGVCTLMMVKECAEQLTGKRLTYRYVNSCKFLAVIHPGQNRVLKLLLQYEPTSDGLLSLQAQMLEGDTVVLKLKANVSMR